MAYTEFYCNASTGSNMNGGSDENTSAAYSATNGGWNSGTGVFTPASGDPSAVSPTLVGQFASVFNDGATTPVFVGRVTAVSSTTVTVSTSAKSGTAPTTNATGRSINVGGVWKGPNGADGFPFTLLTNALRDATPNVGRVNFKNNATYSITAAISNAASGMIVWEGYTTTAGDGGYAVIDGGTSGASYVLFTANQGAHLFKYLQFQNNGASGSSSGVANGATNNWYRVKVTAVRGTGITTSTRSLFHQCEAWACNQSNTSALAGIAVSGDGPQFVRCISHNNSGSNSRGFYLNGGALLVGCIADTNGNVGFDAAGTMDTFENCVAYNNTSHGIQFSATGNQNGWAENCILDSNGGYGISGGAATTAARITNCAFYNNTSGQVGTTNSSFISGSVTLTGSPFNDAANGDFGLDNTASEGASCRGAGVGLFTQDSGTYSSTTTAYPDIGAAQHQDAGGSAGMLYQTSEG